MLLLSRSKPVVNARHTPHAPLFISVAISYNKRYCYLQQQLQRNKNKEVQQLGPFGTAVLVGTLWYRVVKRWLVLDGKKNHHLPK